MAVDRKSKAKQSKAQQSTAKQASNKGGATATASQTQDKEEEEETFVVNETPAQHLYPTETTHLVF